MEESERELLSEPETILERALEPLTWVVAIFGLLVVIGLVIFVIFGFFGSEDEAGLGALAWWGV